MVILALTLFIYFVQSVDILEPAVQVNIKNEHYLPPEVIEKIVCHLDGRTLLKFRLLSKACNVIVNNTLRYNKLWKKICLNEIPEKYFIDILNKHFNGTFIPFDSFSELQYEKLYKNWLQWQNSILNTSCIGDRNLLCLDEVNQIICHNFDVMVVLSHSLNEFSLIKNDAGRYMVIEKLLDLRQPNTILTLKPYQYRINRENESLDQYITFRQINGINICPLHNNHEQIHDGSHKRQVTGKLIDVNTNIYVNACCWVRETFYEYHSDFTLNMKIHFCNKLYSTMYSSVVHGVIIGYMYSNSIVIHNIHKDLCTTINLWLDQKYIGASALYIYTNTLFIGTKNGFLLAYRLRCWDDLINLKDKNLLLETKLNMGRIVKLDIIDFKDVKIIIVASQSRILWIKIN